MTSLPPDDRNLRDPRLAFRDGTTDLGGDLRPAMANPR